jgi:WD40 repeat protein
MMIVRPFSSFLPFRKRLRLLVTRFLALFILVSLSGILSACSFLGAAGSGLVNDTPIVKLPTSVTNTTPLFVPQSVEVINTVNQSSLAPSNGATFPGTTGFTWLPNNAGAALAGHEEVTVLQTSQPGVTSQSAGSAVTQTISSTTPSMLTVSALAERIAWVSDAKAVNALDVSTGTGNPVVFQAISPVTGLALNSKGDQLAYATFDGQAVLLPLGVSGASSTWTLPTWLANLTFSPDASQLAGADLANFTIYFMDAATGATVRKLEWSGSVTPALYFINFSSDWQSVAWIAQNVVQIMNVVDGSLGPSLVHQDSVRSMAWSPDGKMVATASATAADSGFNPVVILWDAATGEMLSTLIQTAPVQFVSFSPDGRQLGILDTNGQLRTWSIHP